MTDMDFVLWAIIVGIVLLISIIVDDLWPAWKRRQVAKRIKEREKREAKRRTPKLDRVTFTTADGTEASLLVDPTDGKSVRLFLANFKHLKGNEVKGIERINWDEQR